MSRFLLYSLVFFTPFLFVQNTHELFEFPKMYFVYLVGSLLIVVTVLERLWTTGCSDRQVLIRDVFKGGLAFLVGLFVISFIVSTIFSTHLYTSIWGYFSRFNGGLISVLIFYGIYWSSKRSQMSTWPILRVVAFTLFPISIYAILQHFGLGGRWESDITARAFATFGQPNWYSSYCAMVLPIALYFGLSEQRWLNKIGWFVLFVLGFGGFWYSYSVSGILGLAVSLGLLLSLNFTLIKKNWPTLIIAALLCLLFAFLNPGIFKPKISDAFIDASKFIQSRVYKPADVVTQKMVNVSLGNGGSIESNEAGNVTTQYAITDSGAIRKGIWKGALKLAVSSPKTLLVGTGPETFPYAFQKYRPSSLNYSSEWNYILNKPHNYYLELLTQNGLLGLSLYLALVIKVLLAKHRIFTPALCGLFISNIFGWPTVSTSLLFWVLLALLTVDAAATTRVVGRGCENLRFAKAFGREGCGILRPAASVLVIAAYLFLASLFVKQYLADIASKKSHNYFAGGNIHQALDYATRSIKLNPNEPFYYRTRAKSYILQTVGVGAEAPNSLKVLAFQDMLKARDLNSQNLSTLRGLVPLYYFLTVRNIAGVTDSAVAGDNIDSFYLAIAQAYYKGFASDYSADVGVLTLVAKYQQLLGLTADYEETVKQIRILRLDVLDWYLK